jgi:hypothetical protein
MRHRWTRLALLAATGALAVPASLGVVALPGVASAAVPAGSAECTGIALSVTKTTANVTLSKCGDTANTGGKGTIQAAALAKKGPQTVKITWANKGTTTTTMTVVENTKPGTKCVKGDDLYTATGSVKSDTGAAKSLKVGNKVSASICINPKTYALNYVKGTGFVV